MDPGQEFRGISESLQQWRRLVPPTEALLWLKRGSALGDILKGITNRTPGAAPPAHRRQKPPPGAEAA